MLGHVGKNTSHGVSCPGWTTAERDGFECQMLGGVLRMLVLSSAYEGEEVIDGDIPVVAI